jgi:hypothetical protein
MRLPSTNACMWLRFGCLFVYFRHPQAAVVFDLRSSHGRRHVAAAGGPLSSTGHLFFCFVTLFSGAQSSVGTHNASKHQGPGDWGQVFFCVCHSLQVSDLNVQCLKGAATAQRFALPPHVNSSAPIMTIAYACETHSCSACAAVTETHSPGAFFRYGLELLGIIARKHWARLPPDNYPQVTAMHLYTLKFAVAVACLVSSSHWCFSFS